MPCRYAAALRGGTAPGMYQTAADLAEIESEEFFPGERLIVCSNPTLRNERQPKARRSDA
jgi:hypothetical protein